MPASLTNSAEVAKETGQAYTIGTSTLIDATKAPLDTTEKHGKIRIAHFSFPANITGDITTSLINMARMPAGKVRILRVNNGGKTARVAWDISCTLSIGHGGYQPATSGAAAVAADLVAFATGLVVTGTTDISKLVNVAIESRAGFTIQGRVDGAAATTEDLTGFIEYTVD